MLLDSFSNLSYHFKIDYNLYNFILISHKKVLHKKTNCEISAHHMPKPNYGAFFIDAYMVSLTFVKKIYFLHKQT